MAKKQITVAICYDFDGTLSPKNMQEYDFMKMLGIKNPADFWTQVSALARKQNADSIAVYMRMMIEKSREKNLAITKENFHRYGHGIELFSGVDTWFERMNKYAKTKGVSLRHYIISSGLKEMIEGTKIAKEFKNIFASSFMYDANGGACWPAVVLNYTSKTQFLFRINKGCENISDNCGVNNYVPHETRIVPFSHMLYIGDGDTDVPCMKLVKENGGRSIAVYNPNRKNAKANVAHLVSDNRVNIILPANYNANKKMEQYVKSVINKIVSDEELNSLEQLSK